MFSIATPPKSAAQGLAQDGLSLLQAPALLATLSLDQQLWQANWPRLAESWGRLPPDQHLKDGGRYRKRRHSCYVQTLANDSLAITPPRPHWQPTEYNALHGGFERWFDPIEPAVATDPVWLALLQNLGKLFAQVRPTAQWSVEAHQFRIDTASGVGRPTPEGAHRDGVDFVVVMLVDRQGVKGGETRVFDAHGPNGVRFEMTQPLTTLLLDDARVIHETTTIQSQDPAQVGWRDTLVLTYRADGFQAKA